MSARGAHGHLLADPIANYCLFTNHRLSQERCLLSSGCEILEQASGTSIVLSPSIFIFKKNSWTVNGLKSSLCNFCSHSLTIFSILLPQTIYVFPYPQSPTSLCGYYWPSWPFLPLINKSISLIDVKHDSQSRMRSWTAHGRPQNCSQGWLMGSSAPNQHRPTSFSSLRFFLKTYLR